ncbi:UPAR/Ly6 domain-containing protein rtv [Halyomorpha halys]|uniref:UPAR/Ly6 domain-containing protein rtv n=1 Tax=Halyomorpha halys TaxID=286706 RepID=UPI0006D509F4|nr:uncharacterized protein LOC106683609 [Halyomorpha halys]
MKILTTDVKPKISAVFVIFICLLDISQGSFTKCFKCRSRGELGSCKDPFQYNNASALEVVQGVEAVPCTSGWCAKILDRGTNSFKDEEYGSATERVCLQRGPADNEERCAPTLWNHEKVFMCFCEGDLCNGSERISYGSVILVTLAPMLQYYLRLLA